MKLYHGTNGKWISSILRNGLQPRGNSITRNNWKHVKHQSNRNCVYMTDSYAPYFAFNAARGVHKECVVIEIETDFLDQQRLIYDEDCWEQLGRGKDGVPGSMSERTIFYRNRQIDPFMRELYVDKQGRTNWQLSLACLGTCCYWGTISPSAITRAITWPHSGSNVRLTFAWDPTITLINQRICGDGYRAMSARLFGDPVPEIEDNFKLTSLNFSLEDATYWKRDENGIWKHSVYSIDETKEPV